MKIYNDKEDFIECIPNVSEGRDAAKIEAMAKEIASTEGVLLLNIDANADANRTVFTFCGPKEKVMQSATKLARYCAEGIDMSTHQGAHPCIGALDVCPFVILGNNDEKKLKEDIDAWAEKLNEELDIPIYFYEKSARTETRKNLANIRKGNYTKLESRMKTEEWKPDLGDSFNPKFGAMVTGLRDFLVAFNLGIPGIDVQASKDIASEIRYSSSSEHRLMGVKAIGWYMPGYQEAQVSVNITDTLNTGLFPVIQESMAIAKEKYGKSDYNSELIGLSPKYFLLAAQDDFGAVNFEELAEDIKLRSKADGIPSIEYQVENPPSLKSLMDKNFT